ncbi:MULTISPECIES: putative quinol monooxygenase [Halobacterium]|uniref:Homolog to autoinducer-2-degrading protein lsrG n=4 Tax=Halobacterium salinarum TaxID=2242 RepID=Q9HHS4_HALSA|nr:MULTISPECIES: putative quinol monooxygenase [Halobacterium]AAG20902.1 Vng6254c [Halobacterium salinarum NRC-1]MBB6090588.1 quinol monooxygenase YgiN [Halobacterium salinarum]MCF2164933.1 antibiotic biosynthesis monooxygenase [Halobacterium salinarum]MCF2168973.1 antibiotic biosynthesis monooxygenase [Halobacterium salinarum]MCF2208054.1 antibiotic biosynthesis monooxygenase [Halobacterium salinarum]
MIVVHATFRFDPDARDDALELIADLVEQSQTEDGLIDYRAAVDVSDPNVVRFFEQYEDAAAFDAHSQTDHFQAFEQQLPELLAGEPEIRRFDVDSVTEPPL